MKLTAKEQKARSMVCLPLDGLASLDELRARVEELSPVVGLFKVGKELFTKLSERDGTLILDITVNPKGEI